eukprot:gene24906-26869_t
MILTKADHPNIIRIHGAGDYPRKFIAIDYLGGGTLSDVIRRQLASFPKETAGLPLKSALHIALQLASALKYLHHDLHSDAMVIHRDLKPENIGFSSENQLKLFDFGLMACVKKCHRTRNDSYKMTGWTGTMAYMAPEVALQKPYNEK